MNDRTILPPREDPSGKLSEFAAKLTYDDIPEEQRDYIKKDILDSICCFLAGSTGPAVPTVLESVRSFEASGKGRILIYGDSLPETLAGFVNGTMARSCDIGDTGVEGGHIVEWIMPTLLTGLARAGKTVSGKEFIAAFAAGAEWGARENISTLMQYYNNLNPGEGGGSRYATVALAKLYGFDAEMIWNAAGMAYCAHPQHTQQKYAEGTPDARLQHGYVTADALIITDLVKRGMTSVHGIYQSIGGLYNNIRHEIGSPDILTEDLGTRWMWREGITNKLYAGCYYNHTPVYGVLSLMKEHGIDREQIASIHFVTSHAGEHTWAPRDLKYDPKTPEAAMFSTPYSVAHAVFTGDCYLEAYRPDVFEKNMENPEFVAFMNVLTQENDQEIKATFDDYIVTIHLKDGSEVSRQITDLPGNRTHAVTWEQVEEKFRKTIPYAAVDLGEEKYNRIIEICRHLEDISDVSCLVSALLP